MDRRDRSLVTLFCEGGSFTEGSTMRLGGDAAHHARVRRVVPKDPIRLLDGEGHVAIGHAAAMGKDWLTVSVDQVTVIPRPETLEVIVPVADRDRMLFAAEKCVELQITRWRPVYFARSRSVSPRGEGPKFREKIVARMRAALEQSGGAWMPAIEQEMEGLDALRGAPNGHERLLLDVGGVPLPGLVASVPTVIAVGPEGGLEAQELTVAAASGWLLASVATTTLRFETAVIAAAAVIRASQLTPRSS